MHIRTNKLCNKLLNNSLMDTKDEEKLFLDDYLLTTFENTIQ